jgi:hypothetical protein
MATRITPPGPGDRYADLRELLSMLAVLIGSRVQRDDEDADSRLVEDAEADEALSKCLTTLQALFRRRAATPDRPRILQWAENLTEVYREAPAERSDSEDWNDYEDRVREALHPVGPYFESRLPSVFLTADQVTEWRGPVEAGRVAAAKLTGSAESTLRSWLKQGVKPEARPWEPTAWELHGIEDPELGWATKFYGTHIREAVAIGDVVELLMRPRPRNVLDDLDES